MSLQARCIAHVFDGLPLEERRALIPQLMSSAHLVSAVVEPIDSVDAKFFHFARQHIDLSTSEVCLQVLKRWKHLFQFSIGDQYVGTNELGDVFLHAQSFENTQHLFDIKKNFLRDFYKEAKWGKCFVSHMDSADQIHDISFAHILTCSDAEFDELMIKCQYPPLG